MLKATTVICALCLAVSTSLFAESFPFALDPLGDGALVGSGLALYGGSIYFQSLKPAPNPADVNAASIPFFDRAYPSSPSSGLATLGDDISIGMAVVPLALLPGRRLGEAATLGVMYGEVLELAYSLDSVLKSVVVRYRPYAYSTSPSPDFSQATIAASFPSANSSLAFAAAAFGAYSFGRLYPDSKAGIWVWAGGLGAATAVSTLLVAGGDHFASDALAGAVIGAASGLLVPLLHERFSSRRGLGRGAVSSIDLAPGLGGISGRISFSP